MEIYDKRADDVIDALGGTARVARLFGCQMSAVSNWRAFNKFPPHTYKLIMRRLRQMGRTADISLWEFSEPAGSTEEWRL